jgi:hypothetical protein
MYEAGWAIYECGCLLTPSGCFIYETGWASKESFCEKQATEWHEYKSGCLMAEKKSNSVKKCSRNLRSGSLYKETGRVKHETGSP